MRPLSMADWKKTFAFTGAELELNERKLCIFG